MNTLPTAEEMQSMREEEIIALIRETVVRLNYTADRLEEYAREHTGPMPGFEVPAGLSHTDENADDRTEQQS